MAGTLENIHRLQEFEAATDQSFVILMSEVILLMPIFRWNGDEWVDCTGDYDLCMSPNGKTMTFISRREGTHKFAYRFISPYWFATRKGTKT